MSNLPIARLLATILEAERLAWECAARQAPLAAALHQGRFLRAQTRQEAVHAAVVRASLFAIEPGGRRIATPAEAALGAYRRRLDRDLCEANLLGSVIGMQIVFEGLGSFVIGRMNLALSGHGERYGPARRLLARQEDSHHAFGTQVLAAALDRRDLPLASAAETIAEYRELAHGILCACDELFTEFSVSRSIYQRRFDDALEATELPGVRA